MTEMTHVSITSGGRISTELHVEDSGGPGRPVVLIHGWPLSGQAWTKQVSALCRAGHRVVTYDRRGFGRSGKPREGFDYDTLAEDLKAVLDECELTEATLVGFSMGGGEVARYISLYGQSRLRSVVFAAAVPPYLMRTEDNPEGPLTEEAAAEMANGLESDREAFFDDFITTFFSVGDELKVTEAERQEAVRLCHQSDQGAALGCMEAFGTTDFRADLPKVTVPTLVVHGTADATVPFDGSGARTHAAIPQSELRLIDDAPHGLNVSHAEELNTVLLDFLGR